MILVYYSWRLGLGPSTFYLFGAILSGLEKVLIGEEGSSVWCLSIYFLSDFSRVFEIQQEQIPHSKPVLYWSSGIPSASASQETPC